MAAFLRLKRLFLTSKESSSELSFYLLKIILKYHRLFTLLHLCVLVTCVLQLTPGDGRSIAQISGKVNKSERLLQKKIFAVEPAWNTVSGVER